jgi:hypothetical protein
MQSAIAAGASAFARTFAKSPRTDGDARSFSLREKVAAQPTDEGLLGVRDGQL